MKKLAVFSVLLLAIMLACTKGSAVGEQNNSQKLTESIKKTMTARGHNVNVDVTEVKKLDNPAGFGFYRILISDANNKDMTPQEQFYFYNGTYLCPAFIDLDTGVDLSQILKFEISDVKVDTSKLSLMAGKKGAKNTIIKITDFECPYCRMANTYLENAIEGKDVAVYIVHVPLAIHQNAAIFAKVFETGIRMDKNFAHELFTNDDLTKLPEDKVVEYFANKSGDPEQFMKIMNSEAVADAIAASMEVASALDISATPVIIINGKRIDGYNTVLMDRAVASFK